MCVHPTICCGQVQGLILFKGSTTELWCQVSLRNSAKKGVCPAGSDHRLVTGGGDSLPHPLGEDKRGMAGQVGAAACRTNGYECYHRHQRNATDVPMPPFFQPNRPGTVARSARPVTTDTPNPHLPRACSTRRGTARVSPSASRFPRIARWRHDKRHDKTSADADTLDTVRALLPKESTSS